MAPTFGELVEKFLVRCEERGLEPATLKSYQYFARSFLVPELGDVIVSDLRVAHFEDLYQTMVQVRYDPSTVRKCHTFAGSVLKYAERQEWVTQNVARLAELPKSRPIIRAIPTPEELARFLKVAKDRNPLIHDYARTMAATGVRPGEACALMQSDLDAQGVLHIERAVDVSHCTTRIKSTKTGRTRKITLDAQTIDVVRGRHSPYVFGGPNPARQDLLSKTWRCVATTAGVIFTPRSMRHFHATQLLGAGMSPRAVADRLGHSTPVVTLSVYAQSIPAHDALAAETIANVLGGAA